MKTKRVARWRTTMANNKHIVCYMAESYEDAVRSAENIVNDENTKGPIVYEVSGPEYVLVPA